MSTPSFFDAIAEVRRRSAESVVARSGLNHSGLAADIRRRFGDEDPTIGGVMHEPILEAAPPYVTADVTMNDLAGTLLSRALVAALDGETTRESGSTVFAGAGVRTATSSRSGRR